MTCLEEPQTSQTCWVSEAKYDLFSLCMSKFSHEQSQSQSNVETRCLHPTFSSNTSPWVTAVWPWWPQLQQSADLGPGLVHSVTFICSDYVKSGEKYVYRGLLVHVFMWTDDGANGIHFCHLKQWAKSSHGCDKIEKVVCLWDKSFVLCFRHIGRKEMQEKLTCLWLLALRRLGVWRWRWELRQDGVG